MAENAIRRARAPVTPFDPAAWLTRFRDVGGWWLIGCDDRAYIGVRIQHTTEAQQRRALQMFEQAHTSPAIGAALSAHLAQAAGGAHV